MGGFIGDLGSFVTDPSIVAAAAKNGVKVETKRDQLGLDMTGFLQLMLAQFQNQSIDDTADTSEMLNQMVQMQMIDAIVNMTDATVMSYAASLVGKEVTVGTYDQNGKLQETVGVITATGTMNGEQVIFIGDECFYMNQILAIGRLPEEKDPPEDGGEDPVDPVDPENPTDPDPADPENPTDPDPTDPENPTNPDNPTTPDNPTDSTKKVESAAKTNGVPMKASRTPEEARAVVEVN